MAIGGHEFDAVEAGLLRVESSGAVLLDNPGNLGGFQRPVRDGCEKPSGVTTRMLGSAQ